MNWWNSLSELERAQALKAAGWKSGGTWTPSPADAWAAHQRRMGQGAPTAVCQVCDTRVPADLLLLHEATHSELEHEIARLRPKAAFIKCSDCGGTGGVETNGPEWVGPVRMESCETCEGTGRLRDENDDEI
jgi:hypothetical protein